MSKKTKQIKAPVLAQPQKTPALLWAILVLALGIKLLYLKFSQASPFYEPLLLDPEYYHDWALRIARGHWDTGVFYGLPLYPYFLALCYKVSDASILFVKLVQIALGVATVFMVYRIGLKLRDARAGLLAAFFAAIYGPLFFHEGIFIPEALGVPLYALSFLLALEFLEKRTVKNAAFLGAAAGLATLTKAGILLFMAGFLIFLAVRAAQKKEGFRALLACALIYLGTLAPVPLHNWMRGGDQVLLTSHAGFNFYIGNNPKAEGVFVAPEGTGSNVDTQIADSRMRAEGDLGRPLKPSEISKYWSDKAWLFIRENPGRFIELCGRKLVLFFDSREISDVDDYQFSAGINEFLRIPWMNFAVLGPLFFMGLISLFWSGRYRGATLAWVGAYLAGLMTFFVNARYRLPLLPVFFALAAMGALDLWENLKNLSLKKMGLLLAALAAGFGISRAHLVGTDWVRDYVNAGDALLEKKDTEGAKEFYRQALKIRPDAAKANLAMGLALSRQGLYDEAKDHYLKSLKSDPNSSQAHNNLGLWYDRRGDLESAEKYFLKAIELKPNSSQPHNNLGMVYGKRGENEKALAEFEASLKLNPDSPRANTNLGLILYRTGRAEEARRLWKRALELDPEFVEAQKALRLMN